MSESEAHSIPESKNKKKKRSHSPLVALVGDKWPLDIKYHISYMITTDLKALFAREPPVVYGGS